MDRLPNSTFNPMYDLTPPPTPQDGMNPLSDDFPPRPNTAAQQWIGFSPSRTSSFPSTSDDGYTSASDEEVTVEVPSTNSIPASKGWDAMKKRIALDLDTKTKPADGIQGPSDVSAMTTPLEQYDVASLSELIVEKHIAARQAFRRTLASK